MFSIVKNWKIFFAITVSFLVIGVGSILFKGFNLGIDFTGGSIMEIQQAVMAIGLSWVLMIAYITLRFEFKFAIAAIIALIIDVLVTLSYFSLLHMEMDSSFVAALLTVVGYSINGTIVIFDRIREALKTHRRNESLGDMVDNCIWTTMTRTCYTVGTSLFAIVSIFLWGGETIHNFSFAMLVGFCSGAYTSVFLAGPLWLMLRGKIKA